MSSLQPLFYYLVHNIIKSSSLKKWAQAPLHLESWASIYGALGASVQQPSPL